MRPEAALKAALAGAAAIPLLLWAYAPALSSYLASDDFQWVAAGMTFSLGRLVEIGNRTHFYRPLVEIYFGAASGIAQCSASVFHSLSLLIHALNAALAGWLVHRLTSRPGLAMLTALLFAFQSASSEAVSWVSAVTALLCATFSLGALLADSARWAARSTRLDVLSTLLFAGALASHEAAVVLLPVAVALRHLTIGRPAPGWTRDYLPWAAVLLVSVVLTAWINSRNYVVTDGLYRVGGHIFRNLIDGVIALYVGRRAGFEYVAVPIGLGLLLWKGTPAVRGWTLWLLLALLPSLPFAGGLEARYLYIAAIPFAAMMATGIIALASRVPAGLGRQALVVALSLFAIGRSASFTRENAEAFADGMAPYARLASIIRERGAESRSVIERDELGPIDVQYAQPLAEVVHCNTGVVVTIR